MATGTVRANTFLGDRRVRLLVFLYAAALLVAYFVLPKIAPDADTVMAINKRGEAAYSALFTFLSVFWAAVLTIWSLLKSRATRYVERLADNVVFKDFMLDLEIRLVLSFTVIILSFVIYIMNPAMVIPYTNSALLIFGWLLFYGASILLLIDSLLTARLVLS